MPKLTFRFDDRSRVCRTANAMQFEPVPAGGGARYFRASTLLFTFAVALITGYFLWRGTDRVNVPTGGRARPWPQAFMLVGDLPFAPLASADPVVPVVPLAERPAPPSGAVDFVRDVKPLLESHCVKCHGPKKASNGYRLHTKAAAFKGGEKSDEQSTDPIVAGDAKASLVFQFITTSDPDAKMPPKGKAEPLTNEQIELLRKWIDGGAKWPDGVELVSPKEGEKK